MSKRALPLFLAFAACHSGSDVNELPSFVAKGSISTIAYDGNNDDLLTGGPVCCDEIAWFQALTHFV